MRGGICSKSSRLLAPARPPYGGSRFSVLYRERYERRGIDSFVSLADLKVVRTKRVISDERCGTCCPFGQKGNFALHPGVNASDLFAHGALVASARTVRSYPERGVDHQVGRLHQSRPRRPYAPERLPLNVRRTATFQAAILPIRVSIAAVKRRSSDQRAGEGLRLWIARERSPEPTRTSAARSRTRSPHRLHHAYEPEAHR